MDFHVDYSSIGHGLDSGVYSTVPQPPCTNSVNFRDDLARERDRELRSDRSRPRDRDYRDFGRDQDHLDRDWENDRDNYDSTPPSRASGDADYHDLDISDLYRRRGYYEEDLEQSRRRVRELDRVRDWERDRDRDLVRQLRERSWEQDGWVRYDQHDKIPNSTMMMRGIPVVATNADLKNEVARYGLDPKDILLMKPRDTGFRTAADVRGLLQYSIPKDDPFGMDRGGPGGLVRTDWDCGKCGASNFRRRNVCFKCGSPREEAEIPILGGGFDEVTTLPQNVIVSYAKKYAKKIPAQRLRNIMRARGRAMQKFKPPAHGCGCCRGRAPKKTGPPRTFRHVCTWTVLAGERSVGYASRGRWRDQSRILRGAPLDSVPEPFRGLTLEERHPVEPQAEYTPEELSSLCPICRVPEIHPQTHRAGALHLSRLQQQETPAPGHGSKALRRTAPPAAAAASRRQLSAGKPPLPAPQAMGTKAVKTSA